MAHQEFRAGTLSGQLKRILFHGGMSLLGLGVFLLICHLYLSQYIEIRKLEERLNSQSVKLEQRTLELRRFEREISFLSTLKGVEKLARERLRYIRDGELIIMPLVDERIDGGT